MKKFVRILPLLFICLALVACKGKTLVKEEAAMEEGKKAPEETVVVPGEEQGLKEGVVSEEGISEEAGVTTAAAEEARVLKSVHFDFDKYTIREEDKAILEEDARWLKAHPDVNVLIEGHADERGDSEYNLALGEKRALSVKKYLTSLGIDPSRLSIISYGEERPVDPGHNEEAWAKNRRAELRIVG